MSFLIAVVGTGAIGSYYGTKLAYGVGANVPRLEVVYALLKSLCETVRGKKSAAKITSRSS